MCVCVGGGGGECTHTIFVVFTAVNAQTAVRFPARLVTLFLATAYSPAAKLAPHPIRSGDPLQGAKQTEREGDQLPQSSAKM
jgi:hypothetical protein